MDLTINLAAPVTRGILDNVTVRMLSTEDPRVAGVTIGMIDWTKVRFVSATIIWGEEIGDGQAGTVEKGS